MDGEELTRIYTAALLRLPCPIQTPEAQTAYAELLIQIATAPARGVFEIPGDHANNERDNFGW